ncbi:MULTISPECIES: helix-turn-helix domain-containing protein [Alphaproteobacteria]|uniref:helix-turn-helix domain-containing protein n=1 Tax=Alphaproteobacteria TaxID=28211 RepID=UPI0012BD53F9|nr:MULTISPECIES: XRE family transcriptional regulator [Alphaproteobacteria]MTI03411.1 XRE family transcriptional regulator [Roseibium sp. RKSG952]
MGEGGRSEVSGQEELDDGAALGRSIRDARRAKGWTLEEAGRVAGIGRSTLSKIENNQTRPSFDIVRRLTQALEMNTPQLFLQSGQTGIAGRRDFTPKGQGEVRETSTYLHELLCSELTSKRMLPYVATITARDISEFETWIRHAGEEFMYVLSGELTFISEHYRPLPMKAGDSLYYDSGMGHGCISTSEEDAQVLWVSLE